MTERDGRQDETVRLSGGVSADSASSGSDGMGIPEAISVEIYDQVYTLRGPDSESVRHLAALVDAKMRAVAANGTVDSLRVAVLAALNIADELMALRARYDALTDNGELAEGSMRSRADTLSEMLDELLEERRAG